MFCMVLIIISLGLIRYQNTYYKNNTHAEIGMVETNEEEDEEESDKEDNTEEDEEEDVSDNEDDLLQEEFLVQFVNFVDERIESS